MSTQSPAKKRAVLLVNLGTPDSTETPDVRRYLREFLSDSRVIEVNPILWWCILNGPILTFRPKKTAAAYKKIWMEESNESPLRYYTRKQADALAATLSEDDSLIIDWAMRYGNPSIASKIDALMEQGCHHITLLPLYPQYSATTTATVCDKAFEHLATLRDQPTLNIISPYHAHPLYIKALADSFHQHLDQLDWTPDVLLTSFHGLPQDYVDAGDPYRACCESTVKQLSTYMSEHFPALPTPQLTFQSRFGPRKWLEPYTDVTLEELAKSGVKNLAIACPGFASDCIETLEEIAMEGQDIFKEHGGENFTLIPCLNDSKSHIELLSALIQTPEGYYC